MKEALAISWNIIDKKIFTFITPYPSIFQGTHAMPMPMGYEQFQPPSSNLNANNSKKDFILSLCHVPL
jgi:hypothetical protein